MSLITPSFHERAVLTDATLFSAKMTDAQVFADQKAYLKGEFLALIQRGDVTARARFAGPGWSLADVMAQALDYTGGPTSEDLYTLIVRLSKGEWPTAEADALIERMAETWADINAEGL